LLQFGNDRKWHSYASWCEGRVITIDVDNINNEH